MRRMRSQGIELTFHHSGLEDLQNELNRAASRIALALIALGLYIAASLLMQHSIGPRLGEMPVLSALGYLLALWVTFRVIRSKENQEAKTRE